MNTRVSYTVYKVAYEQSPVDYSAAVPTLEAKGHTKGSQPCRLGSRALSWLHQPKMLLRIHNFLLALPQLPLTLGM